MEEKVARAGSPLFRFIRLAARFAVEVDSFSAIHTTPLFCSVYIVLSFSVIATSILLVVIFVQFVHCAVF